MCFIIILWCCIAASVLHGFTVVWVDVCVELLILAVQ